MREMKDSGVEWIGKIPKDWRIVQVKHLFRIGRGRVIGQDELVDNGKYPVYSSQTKNDGCLGYLNTFDYDANQLTWTTDGANAGTVFLRRGKHNCTNVCGTLVALNNDISLDFEKYALEHIVFYHKRLDTNGYKIMNNEMAVIKTVFPSLDEQKHIASYLDSKCSQIDAIIEKQQTVIEKIKEYKLSLITETVTKGINPDVPMKDSGVEWIGEVPEHWSVLKFGKCAVVKSNLVNPIDYQEYFQIAPDSIEKNSARILTYRTVRESGVTSWNHLFYKGQILYSKIRPTLNKVAIAPFDGLCSADMYPIETVNDTKFIVYTIISRSFEAQVSLITENRVKMPKINQSELSNIIISIPGISEQRQIADFLDRKCSAIDATISKKQALIEKLKAYKKSLIYEVVTGKKEV